MVLAFAHIIMIIMMIMTHIMSNPIVKEGITIAKNPIVKDVAKAAVQDIKILKARKQQKHK